MNKTKLVVLVVVAACSKKGGGSASAPALTMADADAVNALVPAELKAKATFELQTLDNGMKHHAEKYTFVAPKGWKKGVMPGSLEPEKQGWPEDQETFDNGLGRTEMRVGTNCDGDCVSKDWAKVVDKVYYSQFTGGKVTGKIVKDEKGKNERLMVFQNQPTVNTAGGTVSMTVNGQTTTGAATTTTGNEGLTIIRTWWEDGGSKHYVCQVELAKAAAALEPAFEKACAKVSIED